MIGAIIGDVIGSRYEFCNIKNKDFPLFHKVCTYTDDSVCTIAVAKTLLENYPIDYSDKGLAKIKKSLIDNFKYFVNKYPDCGYGGRFYDWAMSNNNEPYNSWGNGSGMRISPVGWIANSIEEVKKLSKAITEVTHNHPEGIVGAEAVALCIYFARKGKTKEFIKDYIYNHYYPEIDYLNYSDLIKTYVFDVSSRGSIPEAIYCFLISENFEDAIRTAVSIGGDSDTIACMTAAIAEAYYRGTPSFKKVVDEFKKEIVLPNEFVDIIEKFVLWRRDI